MTDTKQKILDTAERLFGEQGYGSTSLRQIIAEAGVNLAAIHYHYGSKEELLDHVILRKAEPLNRKRLDALDRLEAEAGGKPVAIEKTLEAFLRPAITWAPDNRGFAKLSGRLMADGLTPTIIRKHFRHVGERFTAALARALPELSAEELRWRTHFLIGAMSHTLCTRPEGWAPLEGSEGLKTLRRLVAFACGGLRAPVAEDGQNEVNE